MIWKYHSEGPGITPVRMDELGAEGWEAWAVDSRGAVQFKRPVPPAQGGLRNYTMALTAGPPPAYFENAVAFVDVNGHPQWVTAANPLPTTA